MNAPPNHNGSDGSGLSLSSRLLLDAFGRVAELVPMIVQGLTVQELGWRPDVDANPIGWLVWHLSRVQDNHLANLDGSPELWSRDGWADRFGLPYGESAIGYGHSSEEVGRFSIDDPSLLSRYHEAVHGRTAEILSGLSAADHDRVIDDSYEPPVTVGIRLVSVINDTTQHVGQASYVRGLVERRRA